MPCAVVTLSANAGKATNLYITVSSCMLSPCRGCLNCKNRNHSQASGLSYSAMLGQLANHMDV